MKKGEAPRSQTNEPDWVEPELGKELPVTQSAAFPRPAQADVLVQYIGDSLG